MECQIRILRDSLAQLEHASRQLAAEDTTSIQLSLAHTTAIIQSTLCRYQQEMRSGSQARKIPEVECCSLRLVAHRVGLPVRALRELNPHVYDALDDDPLPSNTFLRLPCPATATTARRHLPGQARVPHPYSHPMAAAVAPRVVQDPTASSFHHHTNRTATETAEQRDRLRPADRRTHVNPQAMTPSDNHDGSSASYSTGAAAVGGPARRWGSHAMSSKGRMNVPSPLPAQAHECMKAPIPVDTPPGGILDKGSSGAQEVGVRQPRATTPATVFLTTEATIEDCEDAMLPLKDDRHARQRPSSSPVSRHANPTASLCADITQASNPTYDQYAIMAVNTRKSPSPLPLRDGSSLPPPVMATSTSFKKKHRALSSRSHSQQSRYRASSGEALFPTAAGRLFSSVSMPLSQMDEDAMRQTTELELVPRSKSYPQLPHHHDDEAVCCGGSHSLSVVSAPSVSQSSPRISASPEDYTTPVRSTVNVHQRRPRIEPTARVVIVLGATSALDRMTLSLDDPHRRDHREASQVSCSRSATMEEEDEPTPCSAIPGTLGAMYASSPAPILDRRPPAATAPAGTGTGIPRFSGRYERHQGHPGRSVSDDAAGRGSRASQTFSACQVRETPPPELPNEQQSLTPVPTSPIAHRGVTLQPVPLTPIAEERPPIEAPSPTRRLERERQVVSPPLPASPPTDHEERRSSTQVSSGADREDAEEKDYDTIAGIADTYGVTVEVVLKWNAYLAAYDVDEPLPADLPIVLPMLEEEMGSSASPAPVPPVGWGRC